MVRKLDLLEFVGFAVASATLATVDGRLTRLREAFPWDSALCYLLRDRDRIFGHDFVEEVKALENETITGVCRTRHWDNPHECLDHVIVQPAAFFVGLL